MSQQLAAAGDPLVTVAAMAPQPPVIGTVDRFLVNGGHVLEEVALVAGGEGAVVTGVDTRQGRLLLALVQRPKGTTS